MAKITLRPIERKDLETIQTWRNSNQVLPYCRQYRPLTMMDMNHWYDRITNDNEYNLTNDLFILKKSKYEIVGVGGLVRIDWRNRKAEVSFYVGKVDDNIEDNIGSFLLLLMDYAFQTLNLYKLYWPVYSFNPYLSIYEKFMQREYTAKEEYYWKGKYHDRIVLVKYAKENSNGLGK